MRSRFSKIDLAELLLGSFARLPTSHAGNSAENHRSWKEKLDEQGLKLIEAKAKLGRIRLPATMDSSEWKRWIEEQKDVFSSYPDLDAKRKVKLDSEFVRLYHRANPEIGLQKHELQFLFEKFELPVALADELELAQRFALVLEANQNKIIEAYLSVARGIIQLRQMFSGALRKQLGTKAPNREELLSAVSQDLQWVADMLRGSTRKPPGKLNVELAGLADAILEHQKEPLTQVELYEALKAARAELPEDPEAFRLWLHRARKQGLVKKFRSRQTKVKGPQRAR